MSAYRRSKSKFNPARLERARRARAESRQRLSEYLLEHPCVDCGESDIVVLQFDRRGDNKVAEVFAMVADGHPTAEMVSSNLTRCIRPMTLKCQPQLGELFAAR